MKKIILILLALLILIGGCFFYVNSPRNKVRSDIEKWKEYLDKEVTVSFRRVKPRKEYGDGAYNWAWLMYDEKGNLPPVYIAAPELTGNNDLAKTIIETFFNGQEKSPVFSGTLKSIKLHHQDYSQNGNINDPNEIYAEVEINLP